MTADCIASEQLMVWRTAKPTQWFSRRLDDSGEHYVYDFSAYLTGRRRLWQESTRPNALFLSTAAQLNEGTQRLFSLATPVLDVLRHGRVLVVDELDRSLHTLLVRRLVGMFHDPVLNSHGAQLVFSAHDTSLLDHTLFRRDQV